MITDLKFALRQLVKAPGFTAIAVLTLSLGIGACTAIFSVVNSVLLKPLAYSDSERLVSIRELRPPNPAGFAVAPANYADWVQQSGDVFENIYAERGGSFNLTGAGEPVRVIANHASYRFFETLRAQPMLGRVFSADDDQPGKNQVVVLNHGFWQRQFGGRREIVGESIRFDGKLYTVIGIMPPDFQRGFVKEIITPLALTEEQWTSRSTRLVNVIARLKPGVSVEQAQARMAVIATQLAQQFPETNKGSSVAVVSLLAGRGEKSSPVLFTLLGAVALLLLIACTNVANLLLVRATARQRELCVRAALGATRWRIARQLLVESLLLALVSGVVGLLLGRWGLDALLLLASPGLNTPILPRDASEIVLDARAVGVALAVSALTGVAFGLFPALHCSRIQLIEALRSGGRAMSDDKAGNSARHGLVIAEIALALTLLTGAGLLMRSFSRLMAFDPGFNPHGALRVVVITPREKYNSPEKQASFADAVLQRYRSLPGVTHAGATTVMPMAGSERVVGLEIEGRPTSPAELPSAIHYAVTPDYFVAAGTPLLRGRLCGAQDRLGATPVAIVSESAATQFFPDSDPIGRRIFPVTGPRVWREIIGVVRDVKAYGIEREPPPQAYTPFAQTPSPVVTFVIRAVADPTTLATALRRELHAVDSEQPVAQLAPLDELIGREFARQRFAMVIVGTFSVLALVLAMIGIYGVMAFSVSRRTSEFGIRVALGAAPAEVFQLVLRQAGRLVGVGILAGLASSVAIARTIRSLLYETPAYDPLVFVAIVILVAAIALLACWLPAHRATKVDPIVALRAE